MHHAPTPRRPRARRVLLLLTGVVAVLAVVITLRVVRDDDHSPADAPCGSPAARAAASDFATRCGVIWGAATEPNTFGQLQSVEKLLNRNFDMTYRFHDLDDAVPTRDEVTAVKAGRLLHLSLDSRFHGSPDTPVSWAAVAAGQYDTLLRGQAQGIASLRVPVLVTFDHEPNQPSRSSSGSPADFIAAWRHVRQLFRSAGAANAIWVWVVTGEPGTEAAAASFWPGNRYTDWISWEAYNPSGCRSGPIAAAKYRSFADSALPFFDWIHAHGVAAGIDADKPMMISEAGSVRYASNPELTARWYRAIPHVLSEHPQIRALGLWDRPGNAQCQYGFDHEPSVANAISRAGRTPPIAARP